MHGVYAAPVTLECAESDLHHTTLNSICFNFAIRDQMSHSMNEKQQTCKTPFGEDII